MSDHLIKSIFRNLESNIHERFSIYEDILSKTLVSGNGSVEQSIQVQRTDPSALTPMDRMIKVETNILNMMETIRSVQEQVRQYHKDMEALRQRMIILEAAQKTVAPVPEEVQQEIATNEVIHAPELAEAEGAEVEEQVEEEEVFEEVEVEEEVEEEEEVEVEEEEVEEEEEGDEVEVSLQSFVYARDKKTYWRDDDMIVYPEDEDGNVIDTPIGVWNEKTQKIHPLPK
jgi:hypothetical protein